MKYFVRQGVWYVSDSGKDEMHSAARRDEWGYIYLDNAIAHAKKIEGGWISDDCDQVLWLSGTPETPEESEQASVGVTRRLSWEVGGRDGGLPLEIVRVGDNNFVEIECSEMELQQVESLIAVLQEVAGVLRRDKR